jgi:protein tyrosine phosphatase
MESQPYHIVYVLVIFFITNSWSGREFAEGASNSTAVRIPPPDSSLTTPSTLPSHYLILKLKVAANKFNQTLFLEEFRKYLSFDPTVVVIQPTDSEMEITVYIRNNTRLTSVFIDNFITVWNNEQTRKLVFKQTSQRQVVGYVVVPTQPEIPPSAYLTLMLGVPYDQFNQTLFLRRFGNYITFDPQNIVVIPSPVSTREVRIYVRNSNSKTSVFIKNFIAVWENPNLRYEVFGFKIRQQVAGYAIGGEGADKDFPTWAIALIVILCLAVVAGTLVSGLLCYKRKYRSKRRRRRSTETSFQRKILPNTDFLTYNTRPSKTINKSVKSRPLSLTGLTDALGVEEELVREFQSIPILMSCYEDIPSGSHTKNRYKHVLPTPQTRVPLFLHFDEPTSDYINANFIRGYNDTPKAYIATQSPIESTVNDFWRMVWEHHVTVILMATHLIEGDVPRCTQYWPDNDSATLQCDNLEVKLLNQERNDFSIVSRFHLKQNENMREILHHWFTAWPTGALPDDPSDLIAYLEAVRLDAAASTGPIVVHCSNGIGRTGVILAVLLGMQQLEESSTCDISYTVCKLRQDRGGMIQTKDQYIFTYKVGIFNQEFMTVMFSQLQVLEIYANHLDVVRDLHSMTFQSAPPIVHKAVQQSNSYNEV